MAEVSIKLLTEKSKDLLLGSYLAVALYYTKGYAGLKDGITVLDDMVTTFWEDLHPPKRRARARGGTMDWMRDRIQSHVEKAPDPGPADREILTELVQAIRDLQGKTDELLGNDAPGLGPLRRAVDNKLKMIPEPKAAPEPPPPAPAPAPATAGTAAPPAPAPAPAPVAAPPPVAAPSAPSAPSAGADLSAVNKTLQQTADTLIKCADIIFGAELHNPDSYTLRRVGTWTKSKMSDIAKPVGGKLSFPGNKPGLIDQLDLMLEAEDFQGVVRMAEVETNQRPFWLDPHYYVFRGLSGLGKRYAAAAAAVEAQVRGFANANPQALELSFSNDAPLASGPCRMWLSSGGGGGGGGGDAGEDASLEQKLEAAMAAARAMLMNGEFAQAVGSLKTASSGRRGKRTSFLTRLAVSRLCLEGGKPDLAQSQLKSLQAESDRYALEDWEPDLAVQLLELRWRSAKEHPEGQESADELYERLCGLDLAAALALAGQ